MDRTPMLTVALCALLMSSSGTALAQREGRREDRPRRIPIERVAKRLELGDEQVAALKAIDRERFARIAEVEAGRRLLEYDLQELMAADAPDKRAVFQKVDELAAARAEITKANLAARIQARAILGDKADKLFQGRQARGGQRRQQRRPAEDPLADPQR